VFTIPVDSVQLEPFRVELVLRAHLADDLLGGLLLDAHAAGDYVGV
jgi:hypothetical protein